MFLAPTQPRLKLLSAVSANLVTGYLTAAFFVWNDPISLLMRMSVAMFFISIVLQAERALQTPQS